MLQGIIDIGSNTIRMAIYRIEGGQLTLLFKRKHAVGLAAFVKDGVMSKKGIDKAVEVLNEYREFLAGFRITNIMIFTTAALRNATNGKEAVAEISERTKLNVRIISGDEEAAYGFAGAIHDINAPGGVIVDIGGASCELVAFSGKTIEQKISLPFGSLSLHEKYCEDILPSSAELADLRCDVREMLAKAEFVRDDAHKNAAVVCGIGGTFKGAAALAGAIFGKGADNRTVTLEELTALTGKFCRDKALTEEDVVMLLSAVPDRLQTIVTGMAAAAEVVSFLGANAVLYSDSGVREGYIYDEIIKDV